MQKRCLLRHTTNRILDVLEEERPKVICMDELDKMSRRFQNQLLNFLECGRIKVDQQRKIFATCNEINRLSKPLRSRFRHLRLSPYTKEQFLDIAVKVCPELKEETSRYFFRTHLNIIFHPRTIVCIVQVLRAEGEIADDAGHDARSKLSLKSVGSRQHAQAPRLDVPDLGICASRPLYRAESLRSLQSGRKQDHQSSL
jgi:Cdc6-like AAA superfamily ATPase